MAVIAVRLSLALGACCATSGALAQSGENTPRGTEKSGKGGFSYGGEITGRMNLLAPPKLGEIGPPPMPSPPPGFDGPDIGSRGKPEHDVLKGLKLPHLTPAPRPGAQPTPVTPTLEDPPAPAVAAPIIKQPLHLAATFGDKGAKVPNGVKWRVFTDQPDANGEHLMVAESNDAAPRFDLDPGGYVVHAVYGLVSTARYVSVAPDHPTDTTMSLPAGAIRLAAFVGDARVPPDRVGFTLTRNDAGVTRTVAENVRPGALLRVPAGQYHVVSAYGDANAIVEVDLDVAAGKLVEAQVHHKAARMTLRLVRAAGGAEVKNTSWTVLTPGGDVIRESIGQLPPIVLSEGDYTAIARHDGKMFQQNFSVRAGFDATVELTLN
ncbi:hypothetical protein [Methylopila sp. Yamaguchi]|uniref:hypothetical protein n=1 Tax=Methylopila sp. Yamaguchi TaxID=1437817 RepID=UPI000CBC3202|nr:hypothetical protein [Methylopila sp. Yamaguchi]GBD49014.1 hypothetical protein METY_2227 [Methylopila sp. Yamaguchi]